MANKKIDELRRQAREIAGKGLESKPGFPVPPRKAMSHAKIASKRLLYPVPPYAGANSLTLARWAQQEWEILGRWQSLALPVIMIVALLTWEKEKALQEQYYNDLERAQLKRELITRYGTQIQAKRRRKLLGIIPLPGGR